MRLINADEFKKQIVGMAIINNYPADKANKLCELIDCQPTAYDVDKVVERLKQQLNYAEQKAADFDELGKTDMVHIYDTQSSAYRNSIKIVKSGMKE